MFWYFWFNTPNKGMVSYWHMISYNMSFIYEKKCFNCSNDWFNDIFLIIPQVLQCMRTYVEYCNETRFLLIVMIVSKQRKNLLFKLIMLAIEVYQVYHTKLLLNYTDIRFIFKQTRHKISNILSTFILRSNYWYYCKDWTS